MENFILMRDRMTKLQACRTQLQIVVIKQASRSIFPISVDWKASPRKLNPDLMMPPGMEMYFKKCPSFPGCI